MVYLNLLAKFTASQTVPRRTREHSARALVYDAPLADLGIVPGIGPSGRGRAGKVPNHSSHLPESKRPQALNARGREIAMIAAVAE